MALTRIKQGMIATGAVTPENIEPGVNFTFNGIITDYIQVPGVGAPGLQINSLRSSTSSWVAFYDPSTLELTYGPASSTGGSGNPFNQNLNTTNNVAFANLNVSGTTTATTLKSTTAAITNISATAVTSTNATITNGSISELSATNGRVGNNFTVTSNLYVNGTAEIYRLKANGNIFPVGLGSANQYLKTDGSGNLSWSTIPTIDLSTVTNQTLLTSSTVTFKTVKTETVEGTLGVGKDLYLQTGGNGSIIMRDPTAIATVVGVYGDIIPFTHNKTTYPRNLGSALRRWQNAWIETITVGKNTIYFEDVENASTSTLSIQTGTVYVDGLAVVSQNVTPTSSPVFANTTITNSLTINDYTLPPAVASTAGYAMVSGSGGQIEFQPAVLSSNVSIDGGFANSTYTAFDFAVDGGGAYA